MLILFYCAPYIRQTRISFLQKHFFWPIVLIKYAPAVVLLVMLWGGIGWIFVTNHPPDALGYPHVRQELAQPEGASQTMMFQGGVGRDRHIEVAGAGLFFGITTLLGFTVLIGWGCRSRHSNQELAAFFWNLMVMVGLIFIGVFLMMVIAYQSSWDNPYDPHYLGPFPVGTTLMFLGVCGIPAGFIVLYVLFYSEFILPKKSLARFHELVAARALSNPPDEDVS